MKVKTLQPHVYEGRLRAIGEEYEMEPRFYNHMAAFGHVIRIDDPSTVRTRDLEAEKPQQYRRRDLRAK